MNMTRRLHPLLPPPQLVSDKKQKHYFTDTLSKIVRKLKSQAPSASLLSCKGPCYQPPLLWDTVTLNYFISQHNIYHFFYAMIRC